jgi:transketolase
MAVNVGAEDIDVYEIEQMASRMRKRILEMSLRCEGPTHLGGGLSIVEMMATLYGGAMNFDAANPQWDGRDRFILSKGHGVLGLYTALVEARVISEEVFEQFKKDDSPLIAHPVMNLELGIESSNGSLGQGLSLAVGMAIAARKKNAKHKMYVLMGDGECNEGSVWEAAMSASQFKLGNIIAFVDNNGFQSDGSTEDIITSASLAAKWRSFGWNVIEVDGHDVAGLVHALRSKLVDDMPNCLVAKTIKGKGIPFMEGNNEWHHNRLTQAMFDRAMAELVGDVNA